MLKIVYAGATDVGRVRNHNEDNYAIDNERNLMLVCDGMGGHAAGEVASQIGIETIKSLFADFDLAKFQRPGLVFPEEITPEGKLLVGAIAVANHRIVHHGRAVPGQTGMGTTVVACQFTGGVISVCHVGDSRAYLVRNGNIRRITIDHSWVSELMEKYNISEEEAELQVNKNVITRALGTKSAIRVDISQIRVLPNDIFIICSDGLTGMVADSDILRLADENSGDMDALVQSLIVHANDNGGQDNVTVCAARVMEVVTNEDFEEVRRLTVDWGDDAHISEIGEVADQLFPPVESSPASSPPAEETTRFKSAGDKKKRRRLISPLAFFIFLVVVVIILAVWVTN